MTKIGLITITFNSDKFIYDFVESINNSNLKNLDVELFIIDNASQNNPKELFSQCQLKTKIVNNATNIGVSAANNYGANLAISAGCDVLIFLNNDITFDSDVIYECSEYALCNNAITSPRILTNDTPPKIWYESGGFSSVKGYTGVHRHRKNHQIEYVEYMPTCFSVVPKNLYKEIGGFDELFFVYFDDTDFMYRANRLGIQLVVLQDLTLIHHVGGTTGGVSSPFTGYQTSKNRLLFLRKHFGNTRAALFSIVFLAYYLIFFALRKRSKLWLMSAIKGTISAWQHRFQ